MEKFILASKSPRRKELLKSIGLKFDIKVSDADEESVSKNIEPYLYVQELSLLKASLSAKNIMPGHLVIGSDTIVEYDGNFLGKPKDEKCAYEMLKNLSGNEHRVYSGICVFDTSSGRAVTDYECTKVFFKPLLESDITCYIKTGEPLDKAGAYAIQGKGCMFVEKIYGDYSNVVGLPLFKLCNLLLNEFGINLLRN